MQFEKGRKLKNIKLKEVSFVKTPANRKAFLFFKSAHPENETDEKQEKEEQIMDKELKKLLEEFLGVEIKEEEDIEKAGKLTEKVVTAIKSALGILNKYKDTLPDDAKSAVDTLAKLATTKYPYPNKKGEDDLEKAGRTLSKATIEKLLTMRKLIEELLPDNIKKEAEEKDKDELAFEMLQKMHDKLLASDDEDEEDNEDNEEEAGDVMKLLKGIDSRLEKLEKMKGKKRELDNEDEEDKDDNEDPYPSIKLE